jgi:ParB/RepB/Spo0J family partition protein
MTAVAEPAVMPTASTKPRRGKSVKAAGDQVAAPSAVGSVPPTVQLIALALLDDNPANPRDAIGDVGELAASIRSVGLLQPLVVAPGEGGRFVVAIGHRRKAACELAPLDPVPCFVRGDFVNGRDEEAMLIENLHREDLTPMEEARGYQRLIERGLSQRDIADRVGRNQSHISKRLALLKLPDVARDAVLAGEVSLNDAAAVSSVADRPEVFADAWNRMAVNRWTAKDAVSSAIKAADEAALKAKVTAELTAQGARIIDGYLSTYDYGSQPVALSVLKAAVRKKHDTLPCHVARVDRDGSVTWGCDKPATHRPKPTGPDSPAAANAAARAKAEAAAAAAKKAEQERLAVVASLVTGKPSKPVEDFALDWIVDELLEYSDMEQVVTALGLTVQESDDPTFDDPHAAAVREFAGKGASHRLRLLVATALVSAGADHRLETRAACEALLTAHGWSKPAESA